MEILFHHAGNPFGNHIREKAIAEAVRVMRPGGRLMIADIKGTRHHQAQLAKTGFSDVTGVGWDGVSGGAVPG